MSSVHLLLMIEVADISYQAKRQAEAVCERNS
jgi:hypothetical protein